jgi:hypothetical protein
MTNNTELIICFLTSSSEPVTSNWVTSQLLKDLQNNYKLTIIKINKYLDEYILKSSNEITEEIIKNINQIKFTKKNIIFFTMLFDKYLTNDLFIFLNHRSIISVNYIVDSLTIPYRYYLFAKKFTYIAVPFQESINFFKIKGISNVIYFPYATSIELNKFYNPIKYNKISFVGSSYGSRPFYIDFLKKNNIDIEVKGSNWKQKSKEDLIKTSTNISNLDLDLILNLLYFKNGRKILFSKFLKYFQPKDNFIFNYDKIKNDNDVFKFISDHIISLGISEYGSTFLLNNPISHYRMRDLECPMLGSCHITQSSVDLFNLFEEGKEMLFYENQEDLKEKLRFYLNNPNITTKIGYNSYLKSKSSNRWLNRFDNFVLSYIK